VVVPVEVRVTDPVLELVVVAAAHTAKKTHWLSHRARTWLTASERLAQVAQATLVGQAQQAATVRLRHRRNIQPVVVLRLASHPAGVMEALRATATRTQSAATVSLQAASMAGLVVLLVGPVEVLAELGRRTVAADSEAQARHRVVVVVAVQRSAMLTTVAVVELVQLVGSCLHIRLPQPVIDDGEFS